MTGIIIATIVVWVITVLVKGFGIVAITSLISTGLFCARKIGYFCKLSSLLTWEIMGLALSIVVSLLFKNVNIGEFLLVCLLRCIHIGICYYDMANYVYVKEIVQKGTKED